MKSKYFDYTILGIIVISTIVGFITRLDIGILVFDGLCFAALIIIYFYLCYKEEKEKGQGEENEEEKKP